jgi:nucleoid-associated protein EbfC
MFGKMGDMMGKLREMKEKADEIKRALDNKSVTEDGKYVKIKINGNRKVLEIDLKDGFVSLDKSEQQTQLVAAVNSALESANRINEDEMKKVAGSMMPGLL